jgi:hypothetical protein
MGLYCIRKIVGYKDNRPIVKNILEHRGKNKGNLKIFKGVYTANKYIKKYNLNDDYYIYVFKKEFLTNG